MTAINKIKLLIKKGILLLIKGINHIIPFASVFNNKIQMKIDRIKIELGNLGKSF